jgi:hypothetical protein
MTRQLSLQTATWLLLKAIFAQLLACAARRVVWFEAQLWHWAIKITIDLERTARELENDNDNAST